MASYNRVILIGNLTRDVELRYLASGAAVADIGLAVNDRIKKGDQWQDETTFVDIAAFGRTAEVAGEYLSKGSSALFEGRLRYEQWTAQDGTKRSKLKVVADKMQMLDKKGEARRTADESQPEPPADDNQDLDNIDF
jgi:single-strand DNA-binding protein